MATLEGLPNELLLLVLENVRNIRDLASLARMSHHLNEFATPALYKAAAKKKRHEALVHSAEIGNLAALELLRVCGQDLRAMVKNQKELTRNWLHKQALVKRRNARVPRLQKDIRKLQRAKSMLNYKKYPEVKPPGWKDEAEEKIENKRLEIKNIREEIARFDNITKDPRRHKKVRANAAFRELGAIHVAATVGHSETVRWLLRNGVSAYQKCFYITPGLDATGSPQNLRFINAIELAMAYQRWDVMHVFYLNHTSQFGPDDDSLWGEAIKQHPAESAMKFAVSVASSISYEAGRPQQEPSENDIIDAVCLLLDPADSLIIYFGTEPEDVNSWKERKQQLEEEQRGRINMRGRWQARRKAHYERMERNNGRREAARQDIFTNYRLTLELGKPCDFWGRKKCRGVPRCWACTMHGEEFWDDAEPDLPINRLSINSPGSDVSMTGGQE